MGNNLLARIGLIAVLSSGLGACAADQTPTTVERSNLVTYTATVEAIDQKSRVVTLKGPKGDRVTFKVDKAVKNLPQVSVGDEVKVNYYESLVLRLLKPEESAVNTATAGASKAQPGEMPAASGAQTVTVTVSIQAIDKAKGTVTFKGPTGNVNTVRAADPKNLEKIKVGDRVSITYTETLAVSVEKTKK